MEPKKARRPHVDLTEEDRNEIARLEQCLAICPAYEGISSAQRERAAFELWWCKRREWEDD